MQRDASITPSPDSCNASLSKRVADWVDWLGLRFNPFLALNASADSYLHEYLVAHAAFEAIRTDAISLVFAAAGGGKSALRVRLARACRVGESGRRLFPIVYMVPQTVILADAASRLQAHLCAILHASALELLLHLANRPSEFLELTQPRRQLVRTLLEHNLPGSLLHFLEQLETAAGLSTLAQGYDPSAYWPRPPTAELLRRFRTAMLGTPALADEHAPPVAMDTWMELLVQDLDFEAVYVMVDGIDAYPETIHNAQEALAVLSPLLECATDWADGGLFLKLFLPLELAQLIERHFPEVMAQASSVTIAWTRKLLSDLIKRRIEAATDSAPGSLDMLCEPGLRRLDGRVARAVQPQPREAIAFVERMFQEHVRRAGPQGKLSRADLQAARKWYSSLASTRTASASARR